MIQTKSETTRAVGTRPVTGARASPAAATSARDCSTKTAPAASDTGAGDGRAPVTVSGRASQNSSLKSILAKRVGLFQC